MRVVVIGAIKYFVFQVIMSDSEEEQEQREANVTRNNRMQRARLLDEYGSFMRASGNANIKKILTWLESGLKLEEDRLERVEKILVEGTAKESEREVRITKKFKLIYLKQFHVVEGEKSTTSWLHGNKLR